MANRVLMGLRSGIWGFFVSKPGVNVLTASDDNLMLATHLQSAQIVASGTIADPGSNSFADITIPNLGFQPFVIWGCARYIAYLQYLSNTSLRFRTSGQRTYGSGTSGAIHYAVTNLQRPT